MNFAKTRDVKSPCRANHNDAGIDFFIPNDFKERYVPVSGSVLIPSGIKVKVPEGHALIFMNKSGVATKKGLTVGACVVDESYQGEVHLHLMNNSSNAVKVFPGEKIVQGLLIPINYAMPSEVKLADLYDSESERGEGGFGHTGDGL